MKIARVRCGNTVYEKEIDNQGRMVLGHIGNIPSIAHRLVTKNKIRDENDVRRFFRLITLDPVESVEFIDRE